MKKLIILILTIAALTACKKTDDANEYKVRYVVEYSMPNIYVAYWNQDGAIRDTIVKNDYWEADIIIKDDFIAHFIVNASLDTIHRTIKSSVYLNNELLFTKSDTGKFAYTAIMDTVFIP